jgi:hypothetical protein
MSATDVATLHQMTGEQIARWCAHHHKMVVIEYHRGPDGLITPIIRAHGEPSLNIDAPALVRKQAG